MRRVLFARCRALSRSYRELQLTYVYDGGTYTGPASTLVRPG
jgi:hypothetical protein